MEQKKLYAKLDGKHYHSNMECIEFKDEISEYEEVTLSDIVKRRLRPCSCVGNSKKEEQ